MDPKNIEACQRGEYDNADEGFEEDIGDEEADKRGEHTDQDIQEDVNPQSAEPRVKATNGAKVPPCPPQRGSYGRRGRGLVFFVRKGNASDIA